MKERKHINLVGAGPSKGSKSIKKGGRKKPAGIKGNPKGPR
tara:strand:+ start:3085 stop:3207 length:123 start_codon:yes stop_codon:yes gene_type:complete